MNDVQCLAIIYIIAFALVLVMSFTSLKHFFTDSIIICPPRAQPFVNKTRNKGYGIGTSLKRNCLISTWHISHFLMYFAIGYILPHLWPEAFLIGILWEYFEYSFFDAHDWMDPVYNGLGLVFGILLYHI